MDLREVGYDDRDWIDLAQDRDLWRAYVRAAMNFGFFKSHKKKLTPVRVFKLFTFLPLLELPYVSESSLQLKDSIGAIDSLLQKQVPGPVDEAVTLKLKKVLQRNPGLHLTSRGYRMLLRKKETEDALCLSAAPVMLFVHTITPHPRDETY
ncbi:hypothetical protein ANN_12584 [Periplaneta americana]|uniref:Uncharacterized protein n=1 Tax=Periplaneta americana TaxID=6978 RepID=A0ABQ8THZ9_PERAM|nr:hypothetical protein ANN_12584 [Periplaneta americana]